jgi:hypothetical protein
MSSDNSELTQAQNDQQDFVDNNIHGLLVGITGKELEWDMELISIVREAVQEVVCDRLNLMTEMEFYPYIADEEYPPDPEELETRYVASKIDTRNIAEVIIQCFQDDPSLELEGELGANALKVWEDMCCNLGAEATSSLNALISKGDIKRVGGEDITEQQGFLDAVQRWLKTTTEPYDSWEWDGTELHIILNGKTVETYDKETVVRMVAPII